MGEPQEDPTSEYRVAARLLANMRATAAHDTTAAISMKTGIDADRLDEILSGRSYPDWYEIASFERAYNRRVWPRKR
jgi:hypothetical protein